MNIAIIGAGYVGLVTSVCLAHIGHHVVCVDNNKDKVKRLRAEEGVRAAIAAARRMAGRERG